MSNTISSFSNLHSLSSAGRLVATPDGNYKAANSGSTGSVLGRVVNFVKEAFHTLTGRVKAENAASYERARGDWVRANNGVETPAAKAFFDSRVASHARFDADALKPIAPRPMPGTQQIVQTMIANANTRTTGNGSRDGIAGHPGLSMDHDMTKDLVRSFALRVDGQPLVEEGRFAPTGERFLDKGNSQGYAFCADKVGNALIASFGTDYVEGISNAVHQGLAAPTMTALLTGTVSLQLPDGRPFDPSAFSLNTMSADLSRNADGSVHVRVTNSAAASELSGYHNVDNPYHELTPDSSIHTSYEFDIVKTATPGKWDIANATPINVASDLRLRNA